MEEIKKKNEEAAKEMMGTEAHKPIELEDADLDAVAGGKKKSAMDGRLPGLTVYRS